MGTKFFYAGSFDPFTCGHLSIVLQALNVFDKGIIAIGKNDSKEPWYSLNLRKQMIAESLKYYDRVTGRNFSSRVEITSYEGLTVDAAYRLGATHMVRGYRNRDEKRKENLLSDVNNKLLSIRGISIIQESFSAGRGLEGVSSSLTKSLLEQAEFIAAAAYVLPPVFNLCVGGLSNFNQQMVEAGFSNNVQWLATMSKREYHNIGHVAYMLNWLKIYRSLYGKEEDTQSLLRAIFYHDYVKDDIQKSFEESGLPEEKFGLFEATDHLNLKRELKGDERLIHDFDLAILANDELYYHYKCCVRLEYADVPLSAYIEGRLEVLRKLYRNFRFYVLNPVLERKAKENISREIAFWEKVKKHGLPTHYAGLENC